MQLRLDVLKGQLQQRREERASLVAPRNSSTQSTLAESSFPRAQPASIQ